MPPSRSPYTARKLVRIWCRSLVSSLPRSAVTFASDASATSSLLMIFSSSAPSFAASSPAAARRWEMYCLAARREPKMTPTSPTTRIIDCLMAVRWVLWSWSERKAASTPQFAFSMHL